MLTGIVMKSPRVIAVDRSVLAANMYQLLLRPFGVNVVNASSLADLREALRRFRGADLIVISSNVMADRLERAADIFKKNELISKAAKIFLLRENEANEGWDRRLSDIPRTELMTKPFHPDHFILRVKRILALEE
jgi:CheY-like chemotaxis protein